MWSLAERRLADHCLTQPHWGGRGRDDPGQVARRDSATACDLSACGNFALIGHEDGYVRKYNVQSGEARGTYPASLEAARRVADRAASVAVPGAVARAARAIARVTRKGEEIALRDDGADPRTAGAAGARAFARGKGRQRKHRGGVVGVHCDAANAWCVSCGGDAVKWWSFADHRARGALRVDAACAVTSTRNASNKVRRSSLSPWVSSMRASRSRWRSWWRWRRRCSARRANCTAIPFFNLACSTAGKSRSATGSIGGSAIFVGAGGVAAAGGALLPRLPAV